MPASLPSTTRVAIHALYADGMPQAEIARSLEISPSTVCRVLKETGPYRPRTS